MKKLVCILLATTIIAVSIPSSLTVMGSESVRDLTLSGLISEEKIQESGHVRLTDSFQDNLYQVEYENSDGTYTTYLFSVPVKYFDSGGDVKYIDTSLQTANVLEQMQGYAYKTKANAVDISFPKNADGNVKLKGNGFSFTQKIHNIETERNTKTIEAGSLVYSTQSADNVAKEYSYEPTLMGYTGTVQVTELSEDIVTFEVAGKGISANSVGGIAQVCYQGQKVVEIGGYLEDANGVRLPSASPIVSAEEDCVYITFTADESSFPENVAYPLLFTYYDNAYDSVWTDNATVVSEQTATYAASATSNATTTACAIEDTIVDSSNPNTNYSSLAWLLIGGGPNDTRRIYTKFNLSSLPCQYDQVISAQYTIYQDEDYLSWYTSYECFDVELHLVKDSYNTSTLTWNNKPAHYSSIISGESIVPEDYYYSYTEGFGTYPTQGYCMVEYHFMLTAQVQGWLQGIPNNGIVMTMRNETTYTFRDRSFASCESVVDADHRPYLSVTYTLDTTTSENIGVANQERYYIKCKGSVVEGTTATEALYLTAPSTVDGNITLQPFTGEDNQKWITTRAGSTASGNFYLSPASMSGYSMTPTSTTSSIRLRAKGTGGYQPIKLVRNWDGSYHIRLSYNNSTVIGATQLVAGSLVYAMPASVSMNRMDDWTLEKVAKGEATLFGFKKSANNGNYDIDTDTYICNEGPIGYNVDLAYCDYAVSAMVNQSAMVGNSSLEASDIWAYFGHGWCGSLRFATDTSEDFLVADSNQWPGYSKSVVDYARNELGQLRFALMMACDTGRNDSVAGNDAAFSLVGELYYDGSHCVMSWNNSMWVFLAGRWGTYFFDYLYQGKTIAEARELAYNDVWNRDCYSTSNDQERIRFCAAMRATYYSSLRNIHVLGDDAMCIYPEGSLPYEEE